MALGDELVTLRVVSGKIKTQGENTVVVYHSNTNT